MLEISPQINYAHGSARIRREKSNFVLYKQIETAYNKYL